MFLRCKKRRKDGKGHPYWSIVENRRVTDGRILQRHVLYLGELNGVQEASWHRTVELFSSDGKTPHQVSLFTILGVDTDNGGEFLNCHLHHHFTGRERPVTMTRSRPYQKNDQAHVEQKNSTHVRQLLGHDRLAHHLLVKHVFELLEAWSMWRNCFTTTFKQISKRREGSKTIRVHEKVLRTPCERVIGYSRDSADLLNQCSLNLLNQGFQPHTSLQCAKSG
jgi:hypothetical protein